MNELADLVEQWGELPAFAWPGGYPIVYLTADGGDLCPDCANRKNGSEAFIQGETQHVDSADKQWAMVAFLIHYEGEPIVCDHCNAEIESAYGVPEAEER